MGMTTAGTVAVKLLRKAPSMFSLRSVTSTPSAFTHVKGLPPSTWA
jgi:hypothetical protein